MVCLSLHRNTTKQSRFASTPTVAALRSANQVSAYPQAVTAETFIASRTSQPHAMRPPISAVVYIPSTNLGIYGWPGHAYASSPYFNKRQQMHVIAPWGNPRVDLNSHPFSAAVKYSETFPFLPREIEFVVREKPSAALFAELKMVTNGKELTVREKEFEQIKQDYVPGFVGGHYTALAWTNFNGHCVPMQAELKRFLPNIGLWEVYHCTTEAISSSSETDYLPGLTRPTMVADSRLRSVRKNINSVTYMITNGTWLTASDPRLKPFIAAAMKEGIFLRKPESEQHRPAFVIAIVLLLLTPVFIFWLSGMSENEITQQRKDKL